MPQEIRLHGKTMGTQYHINIPLIANHHFDQKKLKHDIDRRLQAINQEMSTYIPDSTISQFNQSHTTDWFPVSDAFLKLITTAQTISKKSRGAFDITVMPLVNLWGFGTTKKHPFPTQAIINAQRKKVGYQHLHLQAQPPAIRKDNPDVMIDLSAIAKGYAVDELAKLLQQQGLQHFLVEIGGEIRVQGTNKHQKPWKIAIEKPNALARKVQQGLKLDDIAVATSGDYRNYY
ncbi:MAG: FAD:protein FMN transferase ApbE, partial [Aquificaceae bacterium]